MKGLKHWIKEWSVDTVASSLVGLGVEFMVENISIEELGKQKKIHVNEIRRRIRNEKPITKSKKAADKEKERWLNEVLSPSFNSIRLPVPASKE